MRFVAAILLVFVAVASARHSRHRRSIDPKTFLDNLIERFSGPNEEWKALWSKLTIALREQRGDFSKLLQQNQGNMELTLSEFSSQLGDQYEPIKQHWESLKAKTEGLQEMLKQTTLNDVRNMIVEKVTGITGDMDASKINEFFESAKARFLALWKTYQ